MNYEKKNMYYYNVNLVMLMCAIILLQYEMFMEHGYLKNGCVS